MPRPSMNISSRWRSFSWLLPVVSVGCLQDYDQFEFGAGGAPATTISAGGAGPATTTTGVTTATGTSGATTSSTTTSSTTASSTTATTTTAATTTVATTTTGVGGMGPGVVVDCFGADCDVDGGEVCCVANAAMGACEAAPCDSGGDIPISCDSQADCPGEICCVHFFQGDVTSVECSANCSGQNADPLCSASDPCQFGLCVPHADLPGGYLYCD